MWQLNSEDEFEWVDDPSLMVEEDPPADGWNEEDRLLWQQFGKDDEPDANR